MSALQTVSVIMATKNRLSHLTACLQAFSELQDAALQIEVCVVNDGGESIASVVERFSMLRMRWLDLPSAVGQVAARNRAIELASGDVFAFCDDDDRWLPDHLNGVLAAMDRHGSGWGHADAELVELHGRNGQFRWTSRKIFAFQPNADLMRMTNPVIPSSLVCTRALLEDIGHLDESMGHYWDWDLVLRLQSTSPAAQSGVCTVLYGIYPCSVTASQNPQAMRPNLLRLIQKHQLGDLPSLNFERMLSTPELTAYRRASTAVWDGNLKIWNGQ